MDVDVNRIIGALQAQGKHTEVRLTRIETKVDSLLAFKWKVMGVAMFTAFIATLIVEIARAK